MPTISPESAAFHAWLPEALRNNPEVIAQALTHRSATARNNERLEFIGDAVLGLVVAEALYQRLPEATEGDLTRLRAALVNRSALADLARKVGLKGTLNLGAGERKTGGQQRDSILADALEALIGASFQAAGYAAAKHFVMNVYAERLVQLPSAESLKDPKTRLQEWLQGRGEGLPEYRRLDESGPEHQRVFNVEVWLPTRGWGMRAHGPSRRSAEQLAAELALTRLAEEAKP